MDQTAWTQIRESLDDLDFPAAKEDIVRHAEARHAPTDVVRAVHALPPGTYENIGDLRRSVPLDQAADDGQTPSLKAAQARSPHSHRIAEHLRRPD